MITFFTPSDQRERGERATQACRLVPEDGAASADPKDISLRGVSEHVAKNYGKKSYHRNYRLRKVRSQANFGIGALAAADVVVGVLSGTLTNTLRVISCNGSWTIINLAAAVDGGFEFGVSHSDYTAAEIEECLEAQSSMDLGDKVAQEQANRLVRTIGTISPEGTALVGGEISFNEGKPVKVRLNWLLSIGDTLNMWVRNGTGTVYTTGSALAFVGELWVKD